MFNELTYYIFLFLIVAVSQFTKVRSELNGYKPPWTQYFMYGQELLYTAAGIVVLLFNNLIHFKEGVFGAYFFLVISSSYINGLTKESSLQIKRWYNFVVVIIVFGATFYTFLSLLPSTMEQNKLSNNGSNVDSIRTYTFSIPYIDYSLVKHIGKDKFDKRELVYITKFNSLNDSTAFVEAINKFENDKSFSTPIFANTQNSVMILKDKIYFRKDIQVTMK